MRAVIAVCALLAAGWAVAAATGPDTVVIDDVSHWFMPVEFDHAGHVDMAEATTLTDRRCLLEFGDAGRTLGPVLDTHCSDSGN